jgi:hypothetical protein
VIELPRKKKLVRGPKHSVRLLHMALVMDISDLIHTIVEILIRNCMLGRNQNVIIVQGPTFLAKIIGKIFIFRKYILQAVL